MTVSFPSPPSSFSLSSSQLHPPSIIPSYRSTTTIQSLSAPFCHYHRRQRIVIIIIDTLANNRISSYWRRSFWTTTSTPPLAVAPSTPAVILVVLPRLSAIIVQPRYQDYRYAHTYTHTHTRAHARTCMYTRRRCDYRVRQRQARRMDSINPSASSKSPTAVTKT